MSGRYNLKMPSTPSITYLVRNIANDELAHDAGHYGDIGETEKVVCEIHGDEEGVQVVGDGCTQGHHHHGRPGWKQQSIEA